MPEKIHYFLAVRLPEETKMKINQAREVFAEHFDFHKWVHKEDYHITLAFLGFATQNQLIEVKEFVAAQIADVRSFTLSITHIGTFGMKNSPRIFWSGLEESNELQNLRNKVYLACEQAGFQLEKRAFHPHITLARKWVSDNKLDLIKLDKYNVFAESPLAFQATDVVLYKTNLLQTPKYENLITFSLQS